MLNTCAAQLMTMGVPRFMLEGVEADDVIATLAVRAVEEGMHVDIASPDKVRPYQTCNVEGAAATCALLHCCIALPKSLLGLQQPLAARC